MAHEPVLPDGLRAALDELCQFRVFSPKIWLGTSSSEGNSRWREECKVLIRLAGKFANLLHEDGKDKEMVRRGGLLQELTGPGSSLYDAGKVLTRVLPAPTCNEESVDGGPGGYQHTFRSPEIAIPLFHDWMDIAQSKAELLQSRFPGPPESEAIKRWIDELWAVREAASSERLWGARLLLLCQAGIRPDFPEDQQKELRLFLQDIRRATEAAQDTAKVLCPGGRTKSEGAVLREPARAVCDHTDDYHSVIWFGHEFTFTKQQAAAVKLLWEAWEKGHSCLSDQAILLEIDSSSKRLVDVFKNNPAWGTMIVQRRKGTHGLQELPAQVQE